MYVIYNMLQIKAKDSSPPQIWRYSNTYTPDVSVIMYF